MKKNRLRGLAFLAGALSIVFIVGGFAQPTLAQEDNPGETDAMPEGQRQAPQLGRLLNLSPDQLRQAVMMNQRFAPEFRRARQRAALAQQELDAAIYGDVAEDALVLAKVQEFNQAQNELVRLRTLREYRFRQILTPEQLVTLRRIRDQAREQAGANRRRNGDPDGPVGPNRRRNQPGDANRAPGTTFQQRQRQIQPQPQTTPLPAKRPQ